MDGLRGGLYVVAMTILVAIIVGVGAYFITPKVAPFAIPSANVTVGVPPGVPYKQLTTGSWNDRWPEWSPNGTLIAYVSDRSGEDALWIMNASGMNAFQASPDNQLVAYPSWNPNSTMVAFWSMNGQDSEIRAYSLATNLSYHVAGSGPFAVQTAPAWSPNGSLLAFFENGGVPQLMVFDFNTGVSTPVANASGSYLAATWASDDELLYSTAAGGYNQIMWLSMSTGTGGQLLNGSANFVSPIVGLSGQLAFYSDLNPGQNSDYLQGYGGYDVWVSGVDGSNTMFQYSLVHETEGSEQIVEVPYIPGVIDTSVQPAWSPDGTEIVYTAFSAAEGNFLYLWNLSSATTTLIGPFGVGSNACQPSWNPNGMSVAFSSDLGGSYHIWVTNMNGTPASTGNGGY